jgi:hypothetical protein
LFLDFVCSIPLIHISFLFYYHIVVLGVHFFVTFTKVLTICHSYIHPLRHFIFLNASASPFWFYCLVVHWDLSNSFSNFAFFRIVSAIQCLLRFPMNFLGDFSFSVSPENIQRVFHFLNMGCLSICLYFL